MRCPKCGKEIPNDSVFCEFCGTRLKREEVQKRFKNHWYWGIGFIAIIIFVVWCIFHFEHRTPKKEVSEPVLNHENLFLDTITKVNEEVKKPAKKKEEEAKAKKAKAEATKVEEAKKAEAQTTKDITNSPSNSAEEDSSSIIDLDKRREQHIRKMTLRNLQRIQERYKSIDSLLKEEQKEDLKWIEVRKSLLEEELKVEQEKEKQNNITPDIYEDTPLDLEEEEIKKRLEFLREEKDSYDKLIREEVKDSAPKFGLG